MRFYFVRHGESEANVLHVFSNRGWQHGLTELGRQQSLALAQTLKEIPVTMLYTSPLMRAVQTAEILSEVLGVPYETTGALREFDVGVLEGTSGAENWELLNEVWREWLQSGRWEARIEGGESFLDVKERFVPFIEHLVEAHRDTSQNAVLVGHGGTFLSMLPLVLDGVDFEFIQAHSLTNTGYVVAETRGDGLVCLEWHDAV